MRSSVEINYSQSGFAMSDNAEETNNIAAAAEEEKPEEPKSPTMAETDEQQPPPPPPPQNQPQQPETKITEKMASLSFSIWPPTQRTRDAVVNRLVETLSTTSVLSKRYGSMPHDEAADNARRIEEEAFSAVATSASADDDGIEILQLYSKEISKRMLDAVKSRSATGSSLDGNSVSKSADVAPTAAAVEEISPVKSEA